MLNNRVILLFFCVILSGLGCEKYSDLPQQKDLDSWVIHNKTNGLFSDRIWCLHADSKGNIWAGSTERGLMKYDGSQWTNLSTAHGLTDNYVTAIEEDQNGDLWIGTLNGFSIYDGSNFSNFYGTDGNIWTVLSLKSDLQGDMWIGTMSHGLFEVTSNGINEYSSGTNEDANYVNDIDISEDGSVWAATNAGVYKISNNSARLYTTADGLSSDIVKAVHCDSWGDIWMGTWEGEFITKYSEGQFSEVSLFNSTYQAYVNSLTEDHTGNIWIALIADGVVKYDGAAMRSYSVDDGLPGITIMDIISDNKGNIWFGSFEDGISVYIPGITN
ncbi:MAG: two-component regulator propeller domain-containing protein [Bacteroidales bacterium]